MCKQVDAAEWDACALGSGEVNPFTLHSFFKSLEDSKSAVCPLTNDHCVKAMTHKMHPDSAGGKMSSQDDIPASWNQGSIRLRGQIAPRHGLMGRVGLAMNKAG